MKKFTGFKVVSIIYVVLTVLMISLSVFSFVDQAMELGILGRYVSSRYRDSGELVEYHYYCSYFGDVSNNGHGQFNNYIGYILLGVGAMILLPTLASLIMVGASSRKGTTKKGYFVPAIVIGVIGSIYLLGIPLLIASIVSMSKVGKDVPQAVSTNKKGSKNRKIIPAIVLLSVALIIFVYPYALPPSAYSGEAILWILRISTYLSFALFAAGLVLLVIALVSGKKAEGNKEISVEESSAPQPIENVEERETVYSFGEPTQVKEEKPRTSMAGFVIVTIIYAVILVLSVIALLGVNVLWDNPALNKVTGGWLIAYLASYGLYFFLLSPFKVSEKAKKIGVWSSIGGMLLLDILPIVLLVTNFSALSSTKDGSMFKLFNDATLIIISMVVSEIGIAMVYLLSQAKLDPDKFRKREAPKDQSGESALVRLLKILLQIIIGLFNSAVALIKLRDKHANVFSVIVSLLFSFLCVVLAEVMAILLLVFVIGVAILILGKFISFSYIESTRFEAEIDDGYGHVIKVHQYSYMGDDWEDDSGHRYKQVGPDKMIKQ